MTTTNQVIDEKQEEQMVHLVRNALLVAGQEMGNGDHWPVVKSTIYSIMKDWEDLKIERNVHAELKKHLYAQLDEMDRLAQNHTAAEKAEALPKLKELREIYDAYFEPANKEFLKLNKEDTPIHVKRAQHLLKTLEDENA